MIRSSLSYVDVHFFRGDHLGQAGEAKEERGQALTVAAAGRRNNYLHGIVEMIYVKNRRAGKTQMIFEIYLAE